MPKIDETPGFMCLEGIALVERGLRAQHKLEVIYAQESMLPRIHELAERYPHKLGRLEIMSEEDLVHQAGFPFHRGILALAPLPALKELKNSSLSSRLDIKDHGSSTPAQGKRMLIIPSLGDPANLGGVSRSARALGWNFLGLGPAAPRPFTRRVIRTSMGAILEQELIDITDPRDLSLLQDESWIILGADVGPSSRALENWRDEHVKDLESLNIALVLGHEFDGIPPDWASGCTEFLRLPMVEGQDSLNVAAAAAIMLYRLGSLQGLA